ncbi:MAG: glycoside hydrolase family 27 protein [Caldisericaceae bacterium]|nr:glycoside hydrolase family 27 protein [Caldisericaceae bacterium]
MRKYFLFCLLDLVFVIFCFSNLNAQSYDPDTLALTPPMGWNSWNTFKCDINENLIKEIADAMVSSGMKDAGYEYVIIDDCWQVSRDSAGNIQADPEKFPSGIKALADYIHSKGLKFGIYSDAGLKTCQGRPGSRGYEFQDARQYAKWGVDYLKYDWCYHGTQDAKASYALMGMALRATGRPIVYSICEWGTNKPWLWGKEVGGNLWRTTEDILNCWDCRASWGGMGFVHILDAQDSLAKYAGPGHWNDPDMLEVGNSGLTLSESRAHFSLWCVLAAPLIAGNDIRKMTPEIRDILTNKEVIAVDQDSLGKQGRKVKDLGDLEVWSKELRDGSRAVVLFNRSKKSAKIGISWEEIGMNKAALMKVRDLWKKKDLGVFKNGYSATVPPHDVIMIKVTQK